MSEPGYNLERGSPGVRSRSRARVAVESTYFSRFECKYLIDPLSVPDIREFLRSFAEPDRFAARCPGFRYSVCSLYLDSDDLTLHKQTVAGERQRFKLRIRTYSDAPDSRAYLEVKRKSASIVHKRRVGIDRARVPALLDGNFGDWIEELDPERRADVEHFTHHSAVISARSFIRVRYQREAYQALDNEPARVTLDTELCYAASLAGELQHGSGRWVRTPLPNVILEIKFTDRMPWWVHELIRTFGLKQRAVPKYVLCVDDMLEGGGDSPLNIAGISLLPRGH